MNDDQTRQQKRIMREFGCDPWEMAQEITSLREKIDELHDKYSVENRSCDRSRLVNN